MALDTASTPKNYAKDKLSLILTPEHQLLLPAYETEVAGLYTVPKAGRIDPLTISATQQYPLGSLLIQGYRKWRYCRAGTSGLNIAAPVQQATFVNAEQDDDIVVAAAAAVGAKSVWLTSTANLDGSPNETANNFAGGFLVVNDETGKGQCKMIKSNGAFGVTLDSEFELYDALTIALDTSSQVGVIKCPYNHVIATAAPVSGMLVGIPQLAVTASYYFWCQTFGPAACVAHAAIAVGTRVVVGTTAALADPEASAVAELTLGDPMTPGIANTETFIVFLRLD